ncbi:hypothetical protein [Paraburkholderia sp. CI3]|uniref:hypothetical protein n=1 Tax=Paraburkholderia sp. CI3 TaxID=2991060 RepID=UPI003D248990
MIEHGVSPCQQVLNQRWFRASSKKLARRKRVMQTFLNVSPFSLNVDLDAPIFSANVIPKRRCYRALAIYVIEPIQLAAEACPDAAIFSP